MSDFPALKATSGNFRRGTPRSVTAFGAPEDWHLLYLSSEGPTDAVLRLRVRTHTGADWILVDPDRLSAGVVPAAEQARRERLRESGAGITSYSCDQAGTVAAFAFTGQLWTVAIQADAEPQLHVADQVIDPRIAPDGSAVAFHRQGGLHLVDLTTGSVQPLAESADQTWGLAEFIAAEEMGRYRGFWWSPDSQQLLVTAVDEEAVESWWISDPARPAAPPRSIRYPAAGTPNASVGLWLVDRTGHRLPLTWDTSAFPYLTHVSWSAGGALISVQSRDQTAIRIYRLHQGELKLAAEQNAKPWLDLIPGAPALTPDGRLLTVRADSATDSWRLALDADWLTPPDWYIRSIHRCDDDGVWVSATQNPRENHLLYVRWDGSWEHLSQHHGWNSVLAAGAVPVVAEASLTAWQPEINVAGLTTLPNLAAAPPGVPRVEMLPDSGAVRVAVVLPKTKKPAPVIVSSYGGPHAQRVVSSALAFATEQWFADQGFVVVTIDGRGAPGVAPSVEHAIAGDLAGPPLADQVTGLYRAAEAFPGRLDLRRVGITGWSFGGYLAALAVLWNPEVFHAAFAGAPVTDWRLYDTHYTERYLGDPNIAGEVYDRCGLLAKAADLRRPLVLAHGLADDNVVAAHTLQLSAALTAAGRPHQVLPLPGVTHMTPQAAVTENLLRLELDFFQTHLQP